MLATQASAYPAGVKGSHIYHLEVYAALKGMQAAQKLARDRGITLRHLTLGCDNTAAIGTIRRGYSHLGKCRPWLSKWSDARDYGFDVAYIPTKDNVADDPSHFRAVVASRLAASLRRMELHRQGLNGARLPYDKGCGSTEEAPDFEACDSPQVADETWSRPDEMPPEAPPDDGRPPAESNQPKSGTMNPAVSTGI